MYISARYTSACDVWSFGILMWEVFSNGKTPYPGLTNNQARDKIDEGMECLVICGGFYLDFVCYLLNKNTRYRPLSKITYQTIRVDFYMIC